jgi:hypothetical protein
MSQQTMRHGILVPPGPTGSVTSDICLQFYFFILWLWVRRQLDKAFWSHLVPQAPLLVTFGYHSTFYYFMAMSLETIRHGILVLSGPTGGFTSDICLSFYFLFILWLGVSRQWGIAFWSYLVPQAPLLVTFAYRSTFYLFYGYASVGNDRWHFGPIWSHRRMYWWHLLTVLLVIFWCPEARYVGPTDTSTSPPTSTPQASY